MLFDTHTHLTAQEFDSDREQVIRRAVGAGVDRMVAIGYDLESRRAAVKLSGQYEEIYAAVGIHPCYVHKASEGDFQAIETLFDQPGVVAVGETGIDLYHDRSTYALQRASFQRHIAWGNQTGLPVIVHDRDAHEEVMLTLDEIPHIDTTAILHCFTGDSAMAQLAISKGYFLGFGGIATFKNSTVRGVISEIPLEHLLIETDAPYLAPVPHRGGRNEPAFLVHTAEAVARCRARSMKDLSQATTDNAKRVFGVL